MRASQLARLAAGDVPADLLRHRDALERLCRKLGAAAKQGDWFAAADPDCTFEDSAWKYAVHRLVNGGLVEADGNAGRRRYRPAGTTWAFLGPTAVTTQPASRRGNGRGVVLACLTCRKDFVSEDKKKNRVCDACKSGRAWTSGDAGLYAIAPLPTRHKARS
jgi:hypothetical protein